MTSTISVIVPTKNVELTLARCINSLINQTLRPNEIIIVDNGSTDRTIQIINNFQQKYPHLIKREACTVPGAGPTRQRGIDVATSEYIAFLDADDFYHRRTLYFLLAAAQKTGASCGRLIKISKNGAVVEIQKGLEGEITHDILKKGDIIGMSSVMVKKSVLQRIDGFDPRILLSEDYDLHLRVTRLVPYIQTLKAKVFYQVSPLDTLGIMMIRIAYWEGVVWAKHGFFGWNKFFLGLVVTFRHLGAIPIRILRNLIKRDKKPIFVLGIILRPFARLVGYYAGRKRLFKHLDKNKLIR